VKDITPANFLEMIQTHQIALRPLVDMDRVRWLADRPTRHLDGVSAIADTPLEAACEVLAQMKPGKP
jgi:hypothetical protein